MNGLGSSFKKVWTCGSSPRSGSRNVWTRIKNFNGASHLSNIWNFLGVIQIISCRDWWPWRKPGYDTMTWRKSNNQWSGGIVAHPAPKNSESKNPLENLSPRFLWIKTTSSSLSILQRSKLSTRSITHLSWCNWRTSKKKRHGKVTKGILFLHNAPAHWALATQKNMAYLGFQCLDYPPYSPDLAPSDYHLFPGLKNNWKFTIFRPKRRSLLPRRPGWTDNLLIFFFYSEWLAKVRATG